jgi:hypothetical protein
MVMRADGMEVYNMRSLEQLVKMTMQDVFSSGMMRVNTMCSNIMLNIMEIRNVVRSLFEQDELNVDQELVQIIKKLDKMVESVNISMFDDEVAVVLDGSMITILKHLFNIETLAMDFGNPIGVDILNLCHSIKTEILKTYDRLLEE